MSDVARYRIAESGISVDRKDRDGHHTEKEREKKEKDGSKTAASAGAHSVRMKSDERHNFSDVRRSICVTTDT